MRHRDTTPPGIKPVDEYSFDCPTTTSNKPARPTPWEVHA